MKAAKGRARFMCGCGSTSGGGAKQAFVPQLPVQAPVPVQQSYVAGSGGTQLPTQANVNDTSVRNAALAERTLERLRFATRNIDTPEKARAAGYRPNPSAPDHWINDDVFRTRNGFDLERPATVMFENGTLVGVMLSHNQAKLGPPPDLGAGTWHTHGGTAGEEYASHVWLNKPLQSAFGKETGNV